jgi:putative FmdB family regulatory protein
MPTYDYYCSVCDRMMDRMVPIDERDEQWCDECQDELERRITFDGWVWHPTSAGTS